MSSWISNLRAFLTQTDETETDQEASEETTVDEWSLVDVLSTHQSYCREKTQDIINNAFSITHENFHRIDTATDQVDNQQPGKGAFRIGRQIIPEKLFAWYVSQSFIGYQACAFVAQNWLVDRACSLKGRDAVRKGFKICFDEGDEVDPKIIERIEKLNRRFKLKRRLEQADKFKNVYGIYHVLFRVDSSDEEYYEKPFNPDGITPGTYRGMTGIDPYWISPFLSSESVYDPDSLDFYEPNFWYISGKKYHKSHFVILRGPEVSDILKPSYLYGGIPLSQRILERVYAAERTANEAPQLAMSKRLVVRYISQLAKQMAQFDKFENSMEALSYFRDNFGTFLEDAENKIEQHDTSLADLDSVIMTQYQIVAGISGIPATKLLGTSPKGFQSTGEHEIQSYHEELESIQLNDLQPIIDRHHQCLMRSLIAPALPDKKPLTIDITWNPLAVMTEKEQAEVAEIRARTDRLEQDAGAIDNYDIRDRLIADEISGYSGIERVKRPEDIQELPDHSPEEEDLPVSGVIDSTDEDITDDASPESEKQERQEKEIRQEKTEDQKQTTTQDYVKYDDDGWYVLSETGKRLSRKYRNKAQAIKRLRQIELHKHQGDKP